MNSRLFNPWDVFVAGGGPAGLATAIAARRHGLSVVVADGAVPPIDKPCGEGLMPDGVAALRSLGIAIPHESYPFRGIRFVSGATQAEAEFPQANACGMRRTLLHQVMMERAAACGVNMMWRAAVTGLHPEGALVAGELVRARWVVGADGASSRVRRWANLESRDFFLHRPTSPSERKLRFAFRNHYHVAPSTDFMELHWGNRSQVYVTPVSRQEICVALISSSPNQRLRIEDGLAEFPELRSRLKGAGLTSSERGAVTLTRKLRRVYRGRTVLVGDASGGVDAITGQGICLALQQATLLGDCLASDDLAGYQVSHRALLRRPALMARLLLLMARQPRFRERTMRIFQSNPRSFAEMLAMHVGTGSTRDCISSAIGVGWELLKA